MEPELSVWGMQTSSCAPIIYAHRGKLVAQTIEEGTALHKQGCLISVYTARWGLKKALGYRDIAECFYLYPTYG